MFAKTGASSPGYGLWVAMTIVATALTGCASSEKQPPERGASAPVLLTVEDTGPSYQAKISGALGLNDQQCFTLDRAVLLADPSSTVLGDGSGVRLPGFGIVHIGDRIAGAGGVVDKIPDRLSSKAAACVAHDGSSAFVSIRSN